MSKYIKAAAALGFVAALTACGSGQTEEEYVIIDPEPISVEPVYTGKYK